MPGSGREAVKDVREWSGVPPGFLEGSSGCPGVFIRPPVCPVVVRRPYRMSRSGWEALQDVKSGWEALRDVREWSRGPPGCLGVVGRPFWMSGSGWEDLLDIQEWS